MIKRSIAAVLVLSTLFIESAFAESPVATVSAMAHKALSLSGTSADKSVKAAYFSTDLKQFEKHIDDAHWQDFDGDPITGGQDTTGWTVSGVSQSGDIVTVVYSIDGIMKRVGYVVVQENGAWKVNDIIYPKEEMTEGGSFRKMMTGPLLTAPPK